MRAKLGSVQMEASRERQKAIRAALAENRRSMRALEKAEERRKEVEEAEGRLRKASPLMPPPGAQCLVSLEEAQRDWALAHAWLNYVLFY